jgi:hypothetical protein
MSKQQDSLKHLLSAVPPPANASDTPMQLDRLIVESGVGVELPDDLFDLAKHYGSGAFETIDGADIVLNVLSPTSRTFFRDINRHIGMLADYYQLIGTAALPYPIYPDRPGLLPIGNGESNRILSWITEGSVQRWAIMLRTPEDSFIRFNFSLVEFIAGLLAGEIEGYGGSWNKRWFQENRANIAFLPTKTRSLSEFPSIHLAASAGWASKVHEEIQGGTEPNARDHEGCTPLIHGIERQAIEVVKVLLAAGADPNIMVQGMLSPLDLAVRRSKNPEIVRLFLEYGAQVDSRDFYGATPLMRAVVIGDATLVTTLLNAGADPSATTNSGQGPLDLAKTIEIRKLLRLAERKQ